MRQELIWRGMQVVENMERETGLEPATSSLGKRLQIGNKEHCVSWHLVLAIENTAFSPCALFTTQTEHKRSTRIDLNSSSPAPTRPSQCRGSEPCSQGSHSGGARPPFPAGRSEE